MTCIIFLYLPTDERIREGRTRDGAHTQEDEREQNEEDGMREVRGDAGKLQGG